MLNYCENNQTRRKSEEKSKGGSQDQRDEMYREFMWLAKEIQADKLSWAGTGNCPAPSSQKDKHAKGSPSIQTISLYSQIFSSHQVCQLLLCFRKAGVDLSVYCLKLS